MQYPGCLYIDGEKVPTPQSYGWSLEDLDGEEGTGRDAEGKMFRDRVTSKRKLSFTWPPLSIQDTKFLLQKLAPEFIDVQYFDAQDGYYVTKKFYAGPKSANCGHRGRWLGITVNLIEQ